MIALDRQFPELLQRPEAATTQLGAHARTVVFVAYPAGDVEMPDLRTEEIEHRPLEAVVSELLGGSTALQQRREEYDIIGVVQVDVKNLQRLYGGRRCGGDERMED